MRVSSLLASAMLAVIGLSGCATGGTSVTAQDAPHDAGALDRDTQRAVMDEMWETMTLTDQHDICIGWNAGQESFLDAFMRTSDHQIDEDVAVTFFDESCGS